jgi:ParB-like chromosome segregation protein Spo0J
MVPLDDLQPFPRNPNTHSDKQIKLLADIIRAQGWRNPIKVSKRSGFVVAGHGRMKAATLMNCQTVPVDYQDYETEAAEWADLIADNRIAELSEWEPATLKDLLQEMDTGDIDMTLTGYDDASMELLMSQFHVDDDPGEAEDLTDWLKQMGSRVPLESAWIVILCEKDAVQTIKDALADAPVTRMESSI